MIENNVAKLFGMNAFKEQLLQASRLSSLNKRESGFGVYTDEGFSRLTVNDAITGGIDSFTTDLTQGMVQVRGKGMYVPLYHYRIAGVHFHPPDTELTPTLDDIADLLNTTLIGYNLRMASTEGNRNVHDDELPKRIIGVQMNFPQPLSIIGLSANDPNMSELLIYQQKPSSLTTIRDFCDFAQDYAQKRVKGDDTLVEIDPMRTEGLPIEFASPNQLTDFLNQSGIFHATRVATLGGAVIPAHQKRLKPFCLYTCRIVPTD